MKHSKSDVCGKARLGLDIRFEEQSLTSYSGLILFQHFFSLIGIKERLWSCFRHLKVNPIYGHHVVMMLLVVHLIIGHRRLRDVDYYRDDAMVKRVLGLKRLPDASTLSRSLASADERSVGKVRIESRHLVMERLAMERCSTVTLDFDGSVLSTGRHAEGTAVGFNKKKKGARSYYPLFCTVAQTDQVLDVHHRPGNVHDSNGADTFIERCVRNVREHLPRAKIEVRIDSAFFNETIVKRLHSLGVQFTISVPFERFTELKEIIEGRRQWRSIAAGVSYFEARWKPKSWKARARFLFIKQQVRCQDKAPIQLDLFKPIEYGYEFKVIVTNRNIKPRKVVLFHEGRGSQEGIFSELKTHCQMDYIPVRKQAGNKLYMFAGILAHNLTRELQIPTPPSRPWHDGKTRGPVVLPRDRDPSPHSHPTRRTPHSARRKLILSMNSNEKLETELRHALATLNAA